MPPVLAHTPIEMTHLGSIIWSWIWRRTGAIFWLTRPATIMRSACRGEARNTSMPKRARSYRAPPAAIISMAQQARPNVAGQKLALRVQLTSFSTVVSRIPEGSFSSMPMSVPVQTAAAPHVGVRDEHGADEQHHLDEPEQAQRVERHRPRVQEDDLDVEDDEQHRGQVELDRKPAAADRLRGRFDAALVRVELGLVVPVRPGDPRRHHREEREQKREREQAHDRYPQSERHDQLRLVFPSQSFPLANNLLANNLLVALLSGAACPRVRGVPGDHHAAGAIRASPLMIRSIASPPWGSVRLAMSLSTNRISTGWGSPCRVPTFMTCGLPMSFTNQWPSR